MFFGVKLYLYNACFHVRVLTLTGNCWSLDNNVLGFRIALFKVPFFPVHTLTKKIRSYKFLELLVKPIVVFYHFSVNERRKRFKKYML